MASVNKKHKAKNSFLDKGAEKCKGYKCKTLMYYTKADRIKNKKDVSDLLRNGGE